MHTLLPMTPAGEQDERAPGRTERSRDDYDVGRLLAFSDGVFAIAITLLVLGIPVPQLGDHPSEAALRRALLDLLPSLFGFVLSFALVGLYWSLHHQMLRALLRCDARVLTLNLALLLTICLIPFSAALLARYGDFPVAVQVYAANLTFTGFAFAAQRLHLTRKRELADQAVLRARGGFERALLGPLIFLVSIPVASWHTTAAELLWLTLIPAARVMSMVRRRRAGRAERRPASPPANPVNRGHDRG